MENLTVNQKEIADFIKSAVDGLGDSGVYCLKLTADGLAGLCLVIARDENPGEYIAKLAYNTDDLQCNFDYDRNMPTVKETGDVYDSMAGFESTADFARLAQDFAESAAEILAGIASGEIVKA